MAQHAAGHLLGKETPAFIEALVVSRQLTLGVVVQIHHLLVFFQELIALKLLMLSLDLKLAQLVVQVKLLLGHFSDLRINSGQLLKGVLVFFPHHFLILLLLLDFKINSACCLVLVRRHRDCLRYLLVGFLFLLVYNLNPLMQQVFLGPFLVNFGLPTQQVDLVILCELLDSQVNLICGRSLAGEPPLHLGLLLLGPIKVSANQVDSFSDSVDVVVELVHSVEH